MIGPDRQRLDVGRWPRGARRRRQPRFVFQQKFPHRLQVLEFLRLEIEIQSDDWPVVAMIFAQRLLDDRTHALEEMRLHRRLITGEAERGLVGLIVRDERPAHAGLRIADTRRGPAPRPAASPLRARGPDGRTTGRDTDSSCARRAARASPGANAASTGTNIHSSSAQIMSCTPYRMPSNPAGPFQTQSPRDVISRIRDTPAVEPNHPPFMTRVSADTNTFQLADVRRRLKAIFVGSIGNLVEWYDFYAYAAFALYFAGAFFPGQRSGRPAAERRDPVRVRLHRAADRRLAVRPSRRSLRPAQRADAVRAAHVLRVADDRRDADLRVHRRRGAGRCSASRG